MNKKGINIRIFIRIIKSATLAKKMIMNHCDDNIDLIKI